MAVITQTEIGVVMLHIYPQSSADAHTHTNKHKTEEEEEESHEDNSQSLRTRGEKEKGKEKKRERKNWDAGKTVPEGRVEKFSRKPRHKETQRVQLGWSQRRRKKKEDREVMGR